jgi:hypothetical protein
LNLIVARTQVDDEAGERVVEFQQLSAAACKLRVLCRPAREVDSGCAGREVIDRGQVGLPRTNFERDIGRFDRLFELRPRLLHHGLG